MAKLEKMTPLHTIYFHAQRNENKGFTIRFKTESWYINVQLSFNMVQKYKSKFEWYTYNSPGSEYFSRAEIKGTTFIGAYTSGNKILSYLHHIWITWEQCWSQER